MGLNKNTIRRYWNRGIDLGWCKYDPKEESFNGGSRAGKMRGKKVEIFKDSVSLGVFNSATDIERESEKLFGTILSHTNISAVCNGVAKSHKGFTFKQV